MTQVTQTAPELAYPGHRPLGRLSTVMCILVPTGGALAEILLGWVWLSPDLVARLVLPRLALEGASVQLDGGTRLIGFLISMMPMAALLYMLHQAYKLFDAFRLGDVLTADAPVRLRRIGLAMVALAILRLPASTLIGLALTWGNPDGQRSVAIGLGIEDYMIALFGGLMLAIGHAMADAAQLAEEHRQIV